MKRLIKKPKPIWICLILSLLIHFFLISRFVYLLEVPSDERIMEKSYVAHISLKLKTELSSPMENQKKITEDFTKKDIPEQVKKEETPQSLVEAGKIFYQIKQEPEKELVSNKMILAEKVDGELLREGKKISMDNEKPEINRKIKADTEKERNFFDQNKNNEYSKEKAVREDFNITSQEVNYKNEGQVKNNKEIEKVLDFTGNSYPDNVDPPELLEFQRPAYPKNLRERDIEGKVILKALIGKEGRVQEIHIFESSGYNMFDQIAVKSVRQWRFKPARKENQQRESQVLIPINFQIK